MHQNRIRIGGERKSWLGSCWKWEAMRVIQELHGMQWVLGRASSMFRNLMLPSTKDITTMLTMAFGLVALNTQKVVAREAERLSKILHSMHFVYLSQAFCLWLRAALDKYECHCLNRELPMPILPQHSIDWSSNTQLNEREYNMIVYLKIITTTTGQNAANARLLLWDLELAGPYVYRLIRFIRLSKASFRDSYLYFESYAQISLICN